MKYNKVSVMYSATIQMRQFEPLQIMVTAEAQVDPGETFAQVFVRVKNDVIKSVDEEMRSKKKERFESFMNEESLEKSV